MPVGAQKSMCQKVTSVRPERSSRATFNRLTDTQIQPAVPIAIRFRMIALWRCQPKIDPKNP